MSFVITAGFKNRYLIRYFFTQNAKTFFTVFFSLSVFFILSLVIAASSFILKYQISYYYVMRYIALLLIRDIDRLIPFASLISCWIFISSIRSQIAVINNFGIGNFKITKIVLLCYLPIFAALFVLSVYIKPQSKKWIASLVHEIQTISVMKFIKEKEMVSNDGFDIYIENVNKETMDMQDIIIRFYNNCETTFITAKNGRIEENKNEVYLSLRNSKVLSWGNKQSCFDVNGTQIIDIKNIQAEQKQATDTKSSKMLLLNMHDGIESYKIQINSEVFNLSMFVKSDNIKQLSLKTMSTINILKQFKELMFVRFNFVIWNEVFYRIFSPFFTIMFILVICCFLIPKSYSRFQNMFSRQYLAFFITVLYSIISYGFLSESLISVTKSILPSIVNIIFIFAFALSKIKKS